MLAEGAAAWQIDSVCDDLRTSVQHVADADQRESLDAVVRALPDLVAPPEAAPVGPRPGMAGGAGVTAAR